MNRQGPRRPRRISHVRVDLKRLSHPWSCPPCHGLGSRPGADKIHRLRQQALFACQDSLALVRLSQETRATTGQHMEKRVRLAKLTSGRGFLRVLSEDERIVSARL
jgi:hypothetical protein